LSAFTLVILLSGLACKTLLGEPAPLTLNGVKPTRMPSPTPTLAPVSTRLNGENLPDLQFGPPEESTIDRGRPRLSGSGFTLGTEHFLIHYTQTGDDAVASEDANGNEQPDYVEDVARALEYSWYAEIEYFGWAAPPNDGDIGGDERYDIYLANILPNNYAGNTDSDRGQNAMSDNPNSPEIQEVNSAHSFIVLDNDYEEYEEFRIPGITLLEYMRSTAAHEFNHAIQFGYDGEEPDTWFWEAGATWMEDEVFNDVNETVRALPSEFKSTDSCQLTEGGSDRVQNEGHWYGMWIFMRYLSERYGDEAVRRIWELAANLDGYTIWDAFLQEQGNNFEDFFRDFSVALLTRDFEEGSTYPTVRLEGQASGDGQFKPVDGVQQIAADYVEILGHDVFTIQLDSTELTGIAVGIREGQSYLYPMVNNRVAIDTRGLEHTYLIVLNLNRAKSEASCRTTEYTLSIVNGGTPQEPASVKSAKYFEMPKVEDITVPPDELPGG
jgi:hypothetical protein